jgi:hypothetical protein
MVASNWTSEQDVAEIRWSKYLAKFVKRQEIEALKKGHVGWPSRSGIVARQHSRNYLLDDPIRHRGLVVLRLSREPCTS